MITINKMFFSILDFYIRRLGQVTQTQYRLLFSLRLGILNSHVLTNAIRLSIVSGGQVDGVLIDKPFRVCCVFTSDYRVALVFHDMLKF